LVFFSFPFDSGWKAKVNGNDAAILMVDGGLSAISVDPGSNAVSLRFSPPFVKKGLYLTLLGLLIFGVIMFRYTDFFTKRRLSRLVNDANKPISPPEIPNHRA
jgi:uncharacterized membrane protein YfhO